MRKTCRMEQGHPDESGGTVGWSVEARMRPGTSQVSNRVLGDIGNDLYDSSGLFFCRTPYTTMKQSSEVSCARLVLYIFSWWYRKAKRMMGNAGFWVDIWNFACRTATSLGHSPVVHVDVRELWRISECSRE